MQFRSSIKEIVTLGYICGWACFRTERSREVRLLWQLYDLGRSRLLGGAAALAALGICVWGALLKLHQLLRQVCVESQSVIFVVRAFSG